MDERIYFPEFPGDAGSDEIDRIIEALRKSRSLKIRWGINPSAKRLNREYVRLVAAWGVIEGKKMFLASLKKKGKRLWHNLSK
jgi:hypothetical protein